MTRQIVAAPMLPVNTQASLMATKPKIKPAAMLVRREAITLMTAEVGNVTKFSV